MKATLKLLTHFGLVAVIAAPGQLLPQDTTPPAAAEKPVDLRSAVSALEDDFLAQLESTKDLESLFDRYEAQLKKLMVEYPGQPAPYFGLMELFEKCDQARTRRLIDDTLAQPEVPDAVRKIFRPINEMLELVGTTSNLRLETLAGKKIGLDEFKGKVLLIDFWATWCGPCVQEIPKLQAYYQELQADGLEILSVSFDDDKAKLERFITTRGLPWGQVHASAEQRDAIAAAFGVTRGYLPTVFLVGRDGRIRYTLNTRFRLKEKIELLLRES